MAVTKINLDRQAEGRLVGLGTTASAGQALLTLNNGVAASTNVVLDVKGSATVAGDLNLTGNLNITGSVDSQSVTNTNVKDKTITVNDGGTTAGAAGAGIVIEGDANTVIGAITYAAGSASKFQIGNGTTQADIVDVSTVQTLTNKVIGGGQISGNIAGNAGNVTGTVALGNGGTGATTQAGAANAVLPTQATNAGKYLTSDGTNVSWGIVSAAATFKRTTVTGTQDGTNKTFTLANSLTASSEQVIINGQILNPGASNDYTLSGTTLTFTTGFTAPASTDVIQVFGTY